MAKKQTTTTALSIREFATRYLMAIDLGGRVITKRDGTIYDPIKDGTKAYFSAKLRGEGGQILTHVTPDGQTWTVKVAGSEPISFLRLAKARGYSDAEIATVVSQYGKVQGTETRKAKASAPDPATLKPAGLGW